MDKRTINLNNEELESMESECCGYEVYVDCGDEGTCCFMCQKCHSACNVHIVLKEKENPDSFATPLTGRQKKKLKEQAPSLFNDLEIMRRRSIKF